MAGVIRVLVVDDDPLVRVGLSLVLGAGTDIEVVAEAGDGAEAVEATRRLRPDVVLMDIRMPGMDGLAATGALLSAGDGPAVIVLTTFDTDEYIVRALRLGATGFLLKDTPPREILDAVRRVATGESMLSPAVVTRLIRHVARGDGRTGACGDGRTGARGDGRTGARGDGRTGACGDGRTGAAERAARAERARSVLERLTDREREVALAVGAGRSNAEIGADLYMSVATVKAYVSRILTKLECTNRVQVAIVVHDADG
ncbi:response regulator [Planosporangium sp. 12N6]|uniref:response regulator n=1 Tax=Planosporangium spinosum TaxID=3402278 RepID=UPI003CE79C4E